LRENAAIFGSADFNRPQRSASLPKCLSQTGRSDLHLKVGNVTLISMMAAPPVGQMQVFTGDSSREAENLSQPKLHKVDAPLAAYQPHI